MEGETGILMKRSVSRFGDFDMEQLRLLGSISPAKRIRTMLDAQAFVMSQIRGRLRKQYPAMSQREINLKVLAEVARNV